MMVRVRIAPSPTGFFHVGTARTALYNFLFARNNGGKFILRIEDTDIKRSTKENVDVIIESLEWLGLKPDEIYFQSKRFEIYRKYAEKLLKNGMLYYCYCTDEEIKERKEKAIKMGKSWKYDRRCYYLTEEEKEKLKDRKKALRIFIPPGNTEFYDGLHGLLRKNNADIEDFVVIKADGTPSYNFACVIDDNEMGINYVIRGDDHITNTFKQMILYKAFGWEAPKFYHLPMILGYDRSKLSKRHGAVCVLDYKQQGILPHALNNFLSLLGWSPEKNKEIFTMNELISLFSLEKLSKTASVFDAKKLEWLNGEHIKRMENKELMKRIVDLLGYVPGNNDEYLLNVLSLIKERMRKLTDIIDLYNYFFEIPNEYEKGGVEKFFNSKEVIDRLLSVKKGIEKLEEFNLENIEKTIRGIAQEFGIKPAIIIHPVRLAITGKTVGPSLFHIIEVMGKERVIERLNHCIEFLRCFYYGK